MGKKIIHSRAWSISLVVMMSVAAVTNLSAKLGLTNSRAHTASSSGKLPYEAPTFTSIGDLLIGGIVSDAKAQSSGGSGSGGGTGGSGPCPPGMSWDDTDWTCYVPPS